MTLTPAFAKDLHYERLKLLQSNGFNPKVIYDIGAFHGHFSEQISIIYPNAKFHLFEGNDNHRFILEQGRFPCHFVVLGDENNQVTFFK